MQFSNKKALVTGATSGIGKAASIQLVASGWFVTVMGRSKDRCEKTVELLNKHAKEGGADYIVSDFSDLSSVVKAAEIYKKRHKRLDVLINNAAGLFKTRLLTQQGIEMNVLVNHLSHFVLTNSLLGILKKSATEGMEKEARIVNVSSEYHKNGMRWDDTHFQNGGYSLLGGYKQSKALGVLFTMGLKDRLKGSGVTANVVAPGWVDTGFFKKSKAWWLPIVTSIYKLFSNKFKTVEDGAKILVVASQDKALKGVSGAYLGYKNKQATGDYTKKPDESLLVKENVDKAWDLSVKWTKAVLGSDYPV